MNNKTLWIGLVLVVAVFLGGTYFMRGVDTTTPAVQETESQESIESATKEAEMVVNEDGVVEVTVEGTNFEFTPSTLTFSAGDKVRLTFKNTSGNHDFVIDELDVATEILGTGEEETIEFTVPEEAGTFQYYCSVGNHRALGMEGELTIE